jgi:hypothetical protein
MYTAMQARENFEKTVQLLLLQKGSNAILRLHKPNHIRHYQSSSVSHSPATTVSKQNHFTHVLRGIIVPKLTKETVAVVVINCRESSSYGRSQR